jgi:hypothetical protein
MGSVSAGGAYADVLRRLKGVLDPNGILAPGRYEPARNL